MPIKLLGNLPLSSPMPGFIFKFNYKESTISKKVVQVKGTNITEDDLTEAVLSLNRDSTLIANVWNVWLDGGSLLS